MDSNNNNFGSDGFDQGLPNPVDHVITKFISRGIDKLSLEELAVTLITPDFTSTFKKRTGSEWNAKLQVKVIERLTKANFDIQWMTRHTSDPNHPFFVACCRGDIDKVVEFIRKSNEDLRSAIDPTLKTGLHFAAREGHISLVEILIQKGFNVNARERGLKTPLHYACLYGHETIADVLLKNKADIMAKDASGRTAFHFACCATSSRLITLLLGTKPELVNLTDNVGRTGLHYSVWNSSQRQVDIIRTVIENKGDVNALDDDGKTALHHASEGARSRAIPILLQKGADITIRELKNGKTPLDLAPNDTIRQLIIVYSAPPYKVKDDDLRWMDQAIKGEKPTKKSASDKDSMKLRPFEQRPEDKMIIATFLRDKLFTIMRDIQEYGVQNAQHVKRPYLFTGSWMEGVDNLEDLYDKISSVTPLEATIRVFNMFFPYDKPYPEPKSGEPIKSSFYGDVWNFEGAISKENIGEVGKVRDTEDIRRLNQALEVANQRVEEKEDEAARFAKEVEVLKRQIEEFNSKMAKAKQSDKALTDIKRQLSTKDDEITQLKADLRSKKLQIEEQNIELEALQNTQADEDLQEKLDQALNRVGELEREVSTVREKEKSIRFKSGQMFLAALDSRGGKRNGQAKDIDLNLRDDRAIVKLYRALKDNPPSLEDRLKEFDRDGDGRLNRSEFIKVFEKLKLARKDIVSLLRVCGFSGGKELVGIQEFIQILQDRPKLREKWEEELFFKLLDHFKENDIDIDNAFKLMDVSGDGVLSMGELQEGLAKFNIRVTDKDAYALFDIFDESDDGSIQLEEFKAVLKEYEQLQQEQIGAAKPKVLEETKGPKGDMVPTDDATLIHGELKVQIPFSKGIDASISQLFLKYYLLGANLPKIVKSVKLTESAEGVVVWNIAIRIPIILILRENLYDQVLLKIFTNETREDESSYFGEAQIDWKSCLGTPEKWVVNSEFPLNNKSFPKKKVEGAPVVQVKWIPSTSKDYKASNFSKKEIQSEFLSPISDEGTLEFLLATTINCWYHEDVFCDVTFSNGSKKSFKAKFNKEGDAYWNEPHNLELRVTRDTPLNNMTCVVYNKSGLVGKQNIIGAATLDWEDCLKFPGEVNPMKVYVLGNVPKTGKPCKLYVKTKWVSKGAGAGAGAGEVVAAKQTGKKVDENVETGLLKFNIIRARGLMVADMKTSDPLCKLTFNGVEKIEKETEVVKNSLTPQWNKWFELPVKFRKDGFIPPIDLKVYDWDLTFNDLLGLLSVDWTEAYRNPLTWAINEKFKLENPDPEKYKSKNNFGEIYIQAYYAPPGVFDPNTKPEDIDLDKDEQKAIENKVTGTLVVQVVHAKNIYAGEKGKTVNPLAVVNFPNGKSLETDAAKATANPIWKKRMDVAIKMTKEEVKPLVVQIKEDRFLRSDHLLSFVNIPWDECIANPGRWAINKIFKLTGNAELAKNQPTRDFGDIYVQAKFIEEGMADDGKEAEIIEDIAINGTLFINVIFGKGLRIADSDSSDPYCEILLPDKTKLETKTINNILNPVWNYKSKTALKIPYEKYKPIKFDVFDDDGPLMTDDVLGSKELEWKSCLENSGQWVINDLYELDGPEEIKVSKNITSFGHIYVQMMFLKEGSVMPTEVPEVKFDLTAYLKEQEEIMKQSIVGKLFVNVIHGKGLARGDKDSSDSYCRVTFPNGTKVKSETIDKNVNPIWKFKQNTHINIIKKNMKPIKIDVWDHDMGLNPDDHLGYVQIDWDKCIERSGKWAINEIFTIQAPPDTTIVPDNNKWGELYVQVKFLKDGTADDPAEPELIQNLAEILKEESIPIEGKLSIRIIHGKNLPAMDNFLQGGKSDPFVKVILPIGCKDYQTTVCGNNLNPIWNDKKDFDVAIPKNNIRPIKFEVWDEDDLSRNDKIGDVRVSLQDCIDNSGKWHINKIFKIESSEPLEKGQAPPNLGELYVQVMFTKKGYVADPNEPKLLEDLKAALAAEVAQVDGHLYVQINHAKNLYANDGTTSDPYCKIILPGGIKEETPHISKTITPIWKYKNNFKISIAKNRITTLNVQVWDHDKLFDDCIGYIELPLLDIILAPGIWKINGLHDLQVPQGMDPKKAAKGLGQIYLQAMFLNSGMANTTEEPPVTDDIESQVKAKQEKVEGDLHVNIIHAKNLLPVDNNASTSDPFVKIIFNDKELKTKHFDKTLNPIWNLKDNRIAVSVLKSSVPPLSIQVIDHNAVLSNSVIGFKEINIMDELVPNPDKWMINKSLKLTGPQHLVQKFGPAAFGDIYLQMKFVPKGNPGTTPAPDVTEDLAAILKMENELIKGTLKFNVIHAKGLVGEDRKPKNIEAICKIKIPGVKDQISVPEGTKGDKPQWNFKKDVRIAISKKNEEPIRVEVYHHRALLSNVLLGYLDLKLEDIMNNSNKWFLNGNFALTGPENLRKLPDFAQGFGDIYIQSKFVKEGEVDNNEVPPVTEDLKAIIAKEAENVKGTLKMIVVHCRKLLPARKLDPYVKVYIDKTQVDKTESKPQTSNPIWKKEIKYAVNTTKQILKTNKLIFEVWDSNKMFDDKIGYLELSLNEIYDLNGGWYNQISRLNGTDKMKSEAGPAGLGDLYVQTKFFNEGEADDGSVPPLLENLEEILKKENQPIKGKLKVHCVHVKDVIAADNSFIQGSKSDPYCIVTFPDGSTMKTGVTKQNLTAIWKEMMTKDINIPQSNLKVLKFEVWDEDKASADELIGFINVNWKVCIENPGEWAINEIRPLDGPDNLVKTNKYPNGFGTIYIQIQFLPEGMNDPGTSAKLIEDLGAPNCKKK